MRLPGCRLGVCAIPAAIHAAILVMAACIPAPVRAAPVVDLATGPLTSGRANIHPNMVLALSVEFPTVGIAYRGDGGTYRRETEYIGYFNPSKCYRYVGGERNVTDGHFAIAGDADPRSHECDGKSFAGNFMNWAASSAIDMLRYALTGGDRVVDGIGDTILQRAVLPPYFYADPVYFPRRVVDGSSGSSVPGRVTPFQVARMTVVSCRDRILFGTVAGGAEAGNTPRTCDAPAFDEAGRVVSADKSLGEYLARVKVCDDREGPQRPDLCLAYGTHYKPAGVMQRHADRIRFAAMGYLLDDSPDRYGGVLRAPMKYVGPRAWTAPGFTESANKASEWDPDTGRFLANPDGRPEGNSGVVNYLNKFGRNGVYKAMDPVGELYYEAIRYLQGKQPTPAALAGATDAMLDGFPAYAGWTDPVLAACQDNAIVTVADVNTHNDFHVPGFDPAAFGGRLRDARRVEGTEDNARTPGVNAGEWVHRVGEMEADADGRYGNPSRDPALAGLERQRTGAGGEGSFYMAGLAYWANTHDIRFDKPIRVRSFVVDVDEGGDGRIDGSARTIPPRRSQLYLAAKYGGFVDRNGDGNPFVTERDGTIVRGVPDEWDPDGTGAPSTYFLAGQPAALVASIRSIFRSIANPSGTTAGVSSSGARVSTDGAHVYQPGFVPGRWGGQLRRLRVSLDEQGQVRVGAVADWEAGEILTGMGGRPPLPAPAERRIYTSQVDAGGTRRTVEFRWPLLSAAQQRALDGGGTSDARLPAGDGRDRLDWLRGVRTLEAGKRDGRYRARDNVLGDIVNSNPVFVGPPARDIRAEGYADFLLRRRGRQRAVYVGANDGMLHAFDAADGRELFAYVPDALIPKLGRLASPDYLHEPYVDGPIAAGEARAGSEWKSVLVAGFGAGAQGVFALDVTDPSDFGNRGALWEFTDADDPAMGHVVGMPAIGRFQVGREKDSRLPRYRHFAIVSGGVGNNREDGQGRFDPESPGALFLLALDKPAGEPWQAGRNYFRFTAPASDPGLENGLGTPATVLDGDGIVRHVYAGDLQGNLWRFDFDGDARWATGGSLRPVRVFTATDRGGLRQPLTAPPRAVFAPGGGYLLLFGTGRFMSPGDAAPGSFATQSVYGVLDLPDEDLAPPRPEDLALRKATIPRQDEGKVRIEGVAFELGTGAGQRRGWRLDLPRSDKTGERVVAAPQVAYGRLFFNTLMPGADPCSAGGGRQYTLDVLTGLPVGGDTTGALSRVGMLGAPVLYEAGDPDASVRDALGGRAATRRYAVFNFGTGGVDGMAAPAQDGTGAAVLPAGRLGWREIVNWQDLRRAARKRE